MGFQSSVGRARRHLSMLLPGLGMLVLLLFFGFSALFGQSLQVSPSQIQIRTLANGPLPNAQDLSIGSSTASLNWSATASGDAPWISLSATSGTGPGKVSLSLVDWRAVAQPPGNYPGEITFSAPGATPVVVNVIWTVVPSLPNPTFSYLSPVKGCVATSGYPDPAVCQVPNEKPPGNFQPPAVGASYTDPTFGAQVKIVAGAGNSHLYSSNSPLSVNNKYLMVQVPDGSFSVIEVATTQVAFSKLQSLNDFFWDSYVDAVYYYPKGAALIKHDLRTGLESTVIDYAKDGHSFTLIKRGGTTASSKDNWISFFAPNEKQVCTLDLNTVKTYCADYGKAPGLPLGTVDYTLDSKGVDKASKKRYAIVVADSSAVYSVNLTTGVLD